MLLRKKSTPFLLLFALVACKPPEPPPLEPEITTIQVNQQQPFTVSGDVGSTLGIFDPSIVFPAGAPAGAMSYSSVVASGDIHTRIAVSQDKGATWTFLADANQAEPTTIDSTDAAFCPGGTCSGNLVHEVSNMIIDPQDPDPNRLFKLFTHSYVFTNNTRRVDYGFIGLFTAPDPAGPWSAETKLIGWPSDSSISSAGAQHLTTNLSINECLVLTEPGAFVEPDGAISLALGCVQNGAGFPIKIVLLRSTDHGAQFSLVGDMMSEQDSITLGFPDARIQAPYLFSLGSDVFLLATPETFEGIYQECMVFFVPDLSTGEITRDKDGAPVVLRHIQTNPASFSGACAYAEGATSAGYVVPVATVVGAQLNFQMFLTGVLAP